MPSAPGVQGLNPTRSQRCRDHHQVRISAPPGALHNTGTPGRLQTVGGVSAAPCAYSRIFRISALISSIACLVTSSWPAPIRAQPA